MNHVIKRLADKCSDMSSTKVPMDKEIYNEIIDLIINSTMKDEDKISLLVEMYRYGYYNEVRISLDPRGDRNFKTSTLIKIKDALEKNELSEEEINEIRINNNYLKEFIDNPVKFIEEEIKFYSENPNTKF